MSAYAIKRPAYETPDPDGRCWFLDLPEQVLSAVFVKLDRVTLTRCYRVSMPLGVHTLIETYLVVQNCQRIHELQLPSITTSPRPLQLSHP
jgi:hypothetical protein